MTDKLIAWLFTFGAAVARQAAKASLPVAKEIGMNVGMAVFELCEAEINPERTSEEKAQLLQDCLNVGRTAWQAAKLEGLLLLDDMTALVEQASAAQIENELGIQ